MLTPSANKSNTGAKDPEGRTVWAGPRGGLFTIQGDRRRAYVPNLTRSRTRGMSALPPEVLGAMLGHLGTRNVARASSTSRVFRGEGEAVLKKRGNAARVVQGKWRKSRKSRTLETLVAQGLLAHKAAAASPTGTVSPVVASRLKKLGWKLGDDGDFESPDFVVAPGLVARAWTHPEYHDDPEEPGASVGFRLERLLEGDRFGVARAWVTPWNYVVTYLENRYDLAGAALYPTFQVAIRTAFR